MRGRWRQTNTNPRRRNFSLCANWFTGLTFQFSQSENVETFFRSYLCIAKQLFLAVGASIVSDLALPQSESLTARRHIMCIIAMQSPFCVHQRARNCGMFLWLSWKYHANPSTRWRCTYKQERARARTKYFSKDSHVLTRTSTFCIAKYSADTVYLIWLQISKALCLCFFFSPATEEKLQDIRGGPKPETLEMKVTSRVMWPGESLLYSATGAGIKSCVFFVSRYSHYIIIFIMLDFVNTVDSRVEDGEVGAELNVQTRKWFISDQAKKKTSQQSSNIFQIATGCHVYCDAGKQMHLVGLK